MIADAIIPAPMNPTELNMGSPVLIILPIQRVNVDRSLTVDDERGGESAKDPGKVRTE